MLIIITLCKMVAAKLRHNVTMCHFRTIPFRPVPERSRALLQSKPRLGIIQFLS